MQCSHPTGPQHHGYHGNCCLYLLEIHPWDTKHCTTVISVVLLRKQRQWLLSCLQSWHHSQVQAHSNPTPLQGQEPGQNPMTSALRWVLRGRSSSSQFGQTSRMEVLWAWSSSVARDPPTLREENLQGWISHHFHHLHVWRSASPKDAHCPTNPGEKDPHNPKMKISQLWRTDLHKTQGKGPPHPKDLDSTNSKDGSPPTIKCLKPTALSPPKLEGWDPPKSRDGAPLQDVNGDFTRRDNLYLQGWKSLQTPRTETPPESGGRSPPGTCCQQLQPHCTGQVLQTSPLVIDSRPPPLPREHGTSHHPTLWGRKAPYKQSSGCWGASPHRLPSGGWRSQGEFAGTSGMYSFYGMFHITDRYFEAVSSSRAARPPGWAAVCAFSVTKGLGTQSWRFPNTALCLWGQIQKQL